MKKKLLLFFLLTVFLTTNSYAKTKEESQSNSIAIEIINKDVEDVLKRLEEEKQRVNKIEEIKVEDVVKDETVSDELKERISGTLDTAQTELDYYRTMLKSNNELMSKRLLDIKKDMIMLYDFKDEAYQTLLFSRWMLLVLSLAVLFLSIIILIIRRGVATISQTETESEVTCENLRKEMETLREKLDLHLSQQKLPPKEVKEYEEE